MYIETYLNVIAHAFHDYNLAFVLIFAVLEFWLIHHLYEPWAAFTS